MLIDFDQHASIIADSAHSLKERILARRQELDRKGLHRVPLLVLGGEDHTIPAHHLHHVAVLNLLQKEEPALGIAYEYEHNLVSREYEAAGHILTPAAAARLAQEDSGGALSLRTSYRPRDVGSSLQTRPIFFRFMQRSGLPVRFTDAARPGYYLDPKDPSTAESLSSYFNEAVAGVYAKTNEGIYVRNHHMMRKDLEFAEEEELRILYQQCGTYHVTGYEPAYTHDRGEPAPAAQTLSALFKENGIPILGAIHFETGFRRYNIPIDNPLEEDERYFTFDIPELSAAYENGDPDYPPVSFGNRAEEAVYANALLKRMDMEEHMMSPEEFHAWRQKCEEEKQKVFDSIARQTRYEATPPH